MTWFTYKTSTSPIKTIYAPVRREIKFTPITENLKINDWIHISTEDLNLGKTYSIEDNEIVQSFDKDSYLVVYELNGTQTPTYSYIDSNSNLYFKSVSNVESGSVPSGNYYIYYHADNIQYIKFQNGEYVKTSNPSGSNYIASTTGSGKSSIDYYSNLVTAGSTNVRIATIGYISSNNSWQSQKTSEIGAKVFGTFNGPKLKIIGSKGPDYGKVSVKIIKTSMTGAGQQIIKTDTVDLFNASEINDTIIYSIDINSLNILQNYEDIYGNFSFEIEILNEKNPSATDTACKVTKYGFMKNYNLTFSNEEIYEDIVFISTGVVR